MKIRIIGLEQQHQINKFDAKYDEINEEICIFVSKKITDDKIEIIKNIFIIDLVADEFIKFTKENKICVKCGGEKHQYIDGVLVGEDFGKYYNKFESICYKCDEIKF